MGTSREGWRTRRVSMAAAEDEGEETWWQMFFRVRFQAKTKALADNE